MDSITNLRELVIVPATTDVGLQPSPIEKATKAQCKQLARGQMINIIALIVGTNQRENVGQIFLSIIRESSTVIDGQLAAKVAEGFNLKQLIRLLIPVTSARALEAIVNYLNFNIITAKGALGEMKGIASKDNPLYRHMRIREVATVIGFKHIVDQMDGRINGTFYRGGSHRYRLPIENVRRIANVKVVTPHNRSIRQQVVASVVQAHLDGHLTNESEVDALARDIPAFNDALAVERARRQPAAAANAGQT
ncbi:hypothetical protein OHC33_001620 [Knufia fluminis]|uniref:Uncharacterized protein n=1 Tax=Knufia fluminis TaxID=191047 RepID=A0AAN8ERJ7_9EURO|nr:hypothetical protein OHC33_001620 [Knufia fluminis]